MNNQEFTERTGLTPTNEEYQVIEAMYMAAGEMDKDEFCKEYKKHGVSQLVGILFNKAQKLEECYKQKLHVAKLLIGKAHIYNDTDLYNEAVRLVGQHKATLITLDMNLPLWEEDINYIKTNLN